MERLQHQAGRPGGANINGQVARCVRPRSKNEIARSGRRASDFSVSEQRGRFDGFQVLGPQTGLVAIGPDAVHPERPAGQE